MAHTTFDIFKDHLTKLDHSDHTLFFARADHFVIFDDYVEKVTP